MKKGSCQCGKVKFQINGEVKNPSICHCRMCQRAFGNYFAPLVFVEKSDLIWIGNEPKRFQSSNFVKRGFCENCGTPLTYEFEDYISLSIGAFEKPYEIEPIAQYGMEARIPYLDNLDKWPKSCTLDEVENAEYLKSIISYQSEESTD